MSLISAIIAPFSAETGRIAAMRAAWGQMPTWKRWLIGSSVVMAGLAGIGLLLTSFVFTGGATAAILGGVVAGLSIGAGVTSAIANGHTAKQLFEQGKYIRGIFALIGCAAGLLGSLGAIFHIANAVNSAAQAGIGIGSASGTVFSAGGAVVTGCMEQNQEHQPPLNRRSVNQSSDMTSPLLDGQEDIHDSTQSIVQGLNQVPARPIAVAPQLVQQPQLHATVDEQPQINPNHGEDVQSEEHQTFGI